MESDNCSGWIAQKGCCEMEISEDDFLTCPVSIPAVAGDWPHNQLVNLRHDDASHATRTVAAVEGLVVTGSSSNVLSWFRPRTLVSLHGLDSPSK